MTRIKKTAAFYENSSGFEMYITSKKRCQGLLSPLKLSPYNLYPSNPTSSNSPLFNSPPPL